MRGVFVTGTGTGVGKSIAAAALVAALRDAGGRVVASKPLLSGLDEAPPAPWPHDHDLLALASGAPADEIAPLRFGPPVSPHLAARLAGRTIAVDEVAGAVRRRSAADPGATVVVEGAGGLLVPIDDAGATMATLAEALALPLVVVGHPGLGTINHVQLTLEAARARGLEVVAVVLTPWPAEPSMIERDNRAVLETHGGGIRVLTLEPVERPEFALLAQAGRAAGLDGLV